MSLYGDVPLTALTGDTAGISHICQFSWYQFIWYIDIHDPLENRKVGRYLSPSHFIGDRMASKILAASSKVVVRTSIFPISEEELRMARVNEKIG